MGAYENRRKRLQAEAEALARRQLQDGETLLFSSKEAPIGVLGIVLMSIAGVFYLYISFGLLFDGNMPIYMFFNAIALVVMWYLGHHTFTVGKNHCFVTDKRLCLRRANIFGAIKKQDVLISDILEAAVRKHTSYTGPKRTNYHYYVRTMDDKIIDIKTNRNDDVLKTINMLKEQNKSSFGGHYYDRAKRN